MEDTDRCACGHVRDEHGPDPDAPNGQRCQVEGCDCIHFESSESEGDE